MVARFLRARYPGLPAHLHDDLVGLGLEALWKAARSYDPTTCGQFVPYALRAVRWAIVGELRRLHNERTRAPLLVSLDEPQEDRQRHREDALPLSATLPDRAPGPEAQAVAASAAATLWGAVDSLKPAQAYVLRRYYQRGETFGEIAARREHLPAWAKRVHDAALKQLQLSQEIR
jgi:RNA polymerase sigma factor (sigma-70 family)